MGEAPAPEQTETPVILAFLFSDLEGSTRLLAEIGADHYGGVLSGYREVVVEAAGPQGGEVVDREGDGLFLVFPTTGAALRAAAEAQRRLADRAWPEGAEVAARMGIHAGEVRRHEDGYVGLSVHEAARVAQAAWGGQVLVSEAARGLVGDGPAPDLELRDMGTHRLRDLRRSLHLYQLVGPGLRGDFPPPRTLEATPNNLPSQPTSFVGRDRELEELSRTIREARLVTVTGVGGSGKTRLALQAAADLVGEFPGGIWLAELGGITDPALVDSALVEALGLVQRSGATLREAALRFLGGRTALVLLDNCEHLMDAAVGLVDDLLAAAPDCTVVATSREVLGISGEVVYGLRSMGLPEEDATLDPEELEDYDAVQLFVERAGAVRPDFSLTPETAEPVVRICRRLDGMPLALELAASRLRTFGPAEIADLLGQRFRLLTGGSRTALPRQQTLAATLDWSYRLLGETERRFFRRLSVFLGGFTYRAAARVCTDDRIPDVVELLPALVDKSLVVAEPAEDGTRYRLLETVRQFARDRLDETEEGDEVRRRHAEHYRELVLEARPHLVGPDEVAWRKGLSRELDNLRQAMAWSLDVGRPRVALDIAVGFSRHAMLEGRSSEALSWLELALGGMDGEIPEARRAEAEVVHGLLLSYSPHQDRAVEELERAVERYRALQEVGAGPGELEWYPWALIGLAVVLFHQGRAGERNELFTELVQKALEVARRIGDDYGEALALGNLAHHMDPDGDPEEARRLFAEAEEATRALGSVFRLAGLFQQRAFFEFQAGDLEASRRAWRSAIAHAEEAGLGTTALAWRTYAAASEVEMGVEGAAERFLEGVRALFEQPELQDAVRFHQTLLALGAGVDAAAGRFERVAVAAGASEAEGATGMAVRWDLVGHFERAQAAAREALGEEAFEEAAARGRAMTHREVTAFLVEG